MPAYPTRLLNEGEVIALDLKPHWWFFARHIFVGAGLLVLFFLWMGPADQESWLGWPLGVAFLLYAVWLVVKYLDWSYTHFVVTDRRVISRTGVFAKSGDEIPLDRINNINFEQRIWDRIIGAGDLDIESAGRDGQSHFENVRHPDMVQQEIYAQIQVDAKRQASWRNPVAEAAAPAPDVTEQIQKLAGLRDQGHITPEEYERKKAELLERM